jgi:pyridoxal phosphate enzyme (YggS family)
MTLTENIASVQKNIAAACVRAGRDASQVTLIAVSKTHPPEAIQAALAAGVQHFGENRVEEASVKIPLVNAAATTSPTWHMIGHVQSRKAKLVLPLFDVVHSVDSLKLAEKFSALAQEQHTTLQILLEVNISGEEVKDGIQAARWSQNPAIRAAVWQTMRDVAALPGIQVRGLMTMAPFYDDAEQTRPVFADLAALRNALSADLGLPLPELSMGMTNDYEVAIEEGATLIRIGRAIFGERA